MAPNLYASAPVQIGRTAWRMVVRPSGFTGQPVNIYEWQAADGTWRTARTWPTYNYNDGTYAGLPRGLRTRLWDRLQRELAPFGLGDYRAQPELF